MDLDIALPPWVAAADRYTPVTHLWVAPSADRAPVSPECLNYKRVVDIGVSHVHHYDQYESVTGGEMQPMRTRAFLSPEIAQARLDALGLLHLPLIGKVLEQLTKALPEMNYADGYRLFNGPVRDGDGFIDGTCNYYALVELQSGKFALLFQDEQCFFSQRWRLSHPDDYRGLLFSLTADLATDLKKPPLERLYHWDPAKFWCPFRAELIGETSRLAVAAQVVLVTGRNPRDTGPPRSTASTSVSPAWIGRGDGDRCRRRRATSPTRHRSATR